MTLDVTQVVVETFTHYSGFVELPAELVAFSKVAIAVVLRHVVVAKKLQHVKQDAELLVSDDKSVLRFLNFAEIVADVDLTF